MFRAAEGRAEGGGCFFDLNRKDMLLVYPQRIEVGLRVLFEEDRVGWETGVHSHQHSGAT